MFVCLFILSCVLYVCLLTKVNLKFFGEREKILLGNFRANTDLSNVEQKLYIDQDWLNFILQRWPSQKSQVFQHSIFCSRAPDFICFLSLPSLLFFFFPLKPLFPNSFHHNLSAQSHAKNQNVKRWLPVVKGAESIAEAVQLVYKTRPQDSRNKAGWL